MPVPVVRPAGQKRQSPTEIRLAAGASLASIPASMANEVHRCILCRSTNIQTETTEGRIVIARCRHCGATVRIEFDPPDQPGLRGTIEVLVEPAAKTTRDDQSGP